MCEHMHNFLPRKSPRSGPQTRDTHTRTHSTLVSLVSFLSFAYICVRLRALSIVGFSASLLFLLESVALQDEILLPPLLLGILSYLFVLPDLSINGADLDERTDLCDDQSTRLG